MRELVTCSRRWRPTDREELTAEPLSWLGLLIPLRYRCTARTLFPCGKNDLSLTCHHQVVKLEEEWGEYLCGKKQYETAIVHLIEAG